VTPIHRVTVVVSGDALTIEYRDGSPDERLSVRPGQVDWDEPTSRVHRGVNVGRGLYEEIAVFFLAQANAAAQPVSENEDNDACSTGLRRSRKALRATPQRSYPSAMAGTASRTSSVSPQSCATVQDAFS
jgi:hypothetical protein